MDGFDEAADAAPEQQVFEAEAAQDFGGFDAPAGSAEAPSPVAAAAPVSIPAPSAVPEPASAYTAFTVKFRQLVEEKDAKEREAKGARKAAGKAALGKMLAERSERIETRKAANREAEAAAEKEMLDALNGESWGRVVSLVDIHGHGAAAAAGSASSAAEAKQHHHHKKGEHAGDKDGAVGETTRMKNLLVQLKAKPLAPQTA